MPRHFFEQDPEIARQVASNAGDTEAVSMEESKARILSGNVLPKLPDAEISLVDIDVVEEDDGPRAQFGQPGLEVVPDGLVRVSPVDVQEVDASVGKMAKRLVERRSNQAGEPAEVLIVKG